MWSLLTKTTIRALYRDKAYTLINIVGLSIGIACCLVIGTYLSFELTYDQHNTNSSRLYRVVAEYTIDGRSSTTAKTSPLLAPALAESLGDMQAYVRFQAPWSIGSSDEQFVRSGDKGYYWSGVYAADENVFDVFTHTILLGDPETALSDMSSAAVSETFARKYFGTGNALGKTITLANGDLRTIRLVFADLPGNSHLQYDLLLSYKSVDQDPGELRSYWGWSDFTYVLMSESYSGGSFAPFSKRIFDRYMADHAKAINGSWSAWLQPIAGIHLDSDIGSDLPTGSRYAVMGFSAVGLFVLLVACINYINLATARATRRAKEIGVRKILGATRGPLVLQFLLESIFLSLVASIVAVALFFLARKIPVVQELLGDFSRSGLANAGSYLAWIFGAGVVIGLLAGLYPALYVSSIAPARGLMGSRGGTGNNATVRQVLVVVQFMITTAIVSATLLMYAQMEFVASQPLGYEKSGRLVIPLHGLDVIERFPAIQNELERNERILGVTATDRLMGVTELFTFFETENTDGKIVNVTTHMMPVATNYFGVMGMKFVEGRGFSVTDTADTTIIVNEAVVRQMGWRQPLGKLMGARHRQVIGVVKDFNFQSLHRNVEPIALYPYRTNFDSMPVRERASRDRYMIVKISAHELGETLGYVQEVLGKFDPVHPFEYRFLDDVLAQLYQSESRFMKLVGLFSAVCIVVALIGLIGTSAYTISRRAKEISIRKVLGASTIQIIGLMYRETFRLLLIASALGSVVAYVVMDTWLSTFAIHISIGPGAFLVSILAMVIVVGSTVAIQSRHAATAHPAETLRFE